MRVLFLLSLAALWLPALAADLLQVYAQARAADPLLAAEQARRSVQQEVGVQARAALLPQASATVSTQRQDGSRSEGWGAQISQPLWDLSAWRNWDAARSEDAARDARLRAAEQDLCARVARAYFGVLSAQAALANAQANEAAFALQVSQASKRFEARLTAALDVEQARAYHELSRGNTLQAQQTLADAHQALAQITGQLTPELSALSADMPALPPEPTDAQAWVQQALAGNPLLQSQALGVLASGQRVDAARAAHGPTLSFTVDHNRISFNSNGSDTQLALRLKVPLFAGGATQSAVRQAGFQHDAAQHTLEAARRALQRETQAQFQAVTAGAQLVKSTRAAVSAANLALASTRAGQALGTRSMSDLLLAIQTQTAAQGALEQARHGYVLARLLLAQAAGTLNEGLLATVNPWLFPATPATTRSP